MKPAALPSRLMLACEQLDVAAELFVAERSYVSALTLAGAAEEILGSAVSARNEEPALARRFSARFRAIEGMKFLPPDRKAFFNSQNYARNAAKHMSPRRGDRCLTSEDRYFKVDPRAAAMDMILRGMHNKNLLGIPESSICNQFYALYLYELHREE